MNPVIEQLTRVRTNKQYNIPEPFKFTEAYIPATLANGYLTEYRFGCTFEVIKRISEDAIINSKADVMILVRDSVRGEITDAVYGKYIKQLYQLRTKCYTLNQLDLATEVEKIINDIKGT